MMVVNFYTLILLLVLFFILFLLTEADGSRNDSFSISSLLSDITTVVSSSDIKLFSDDKASLTEGQS